MQPTIIFSSRAAGMLRLNGRFVGEIAAHRPLCLPVAPTGTLYMEFEPLLPGYLPLARRCALSGGAPVAASLADAGGVYCLTWPGGVIEMELVPAGSAPRLSVLGDAPCALWPGDGARLTLGDIDVRLPEDADIPELLRAGPAPVLLGSTRSGGQYLAVLAPDGSGQTGLIEARRIPPGEDGLFDVLFDPEDTVGHALLEQWRADATGLTRLSRQTVWVEGAPRWPATAEQTAIAAVEAALLRLHAEAEGYLSPALAETLRPEALVESFSLCVPMRHLPPDSRPCVGLVRLENPRLARVQPLFYEAEPAASTQGPWRLTRLALE